MKDYYTILGVDPDASPKLIKLAYRRLARENHPDRMSHLSAAEQAECSARMAEINEAYAVLSNSGQKREYDQKLRGHQTGEPVETRPPPESVTVETPRAAPTRVRPQEMAQMASTIVLKFGYQLRDELLAHRKPLFWREMALEGFDWALHAGLWFSQYWIASRGFAAADPAAAQKLINYANLAIVRCTRIYHKSFFLFLMPFQQIFDLEQVSALCRRFSVTVNSSSRATNPLIALLDLSHGHSLLCGPKGRDRRFGEVLQQLKLGRS